LKVRAGIILVAVCGLVSIVRAGGGFEKAIEAALPRVVKLYGLGAGQQKGYGTGVIISADGLVLTVYSLLIDADTVRATTADGKLYEASVVFHDRERQLSLLRLRGAGQSENAEGNGSTKEFVGASGAEGTVRLKPTIGPFPYFEVSCATPPSESAPCGPPLRPGDWVLAAGNAFKVADGPEPVSIAHGVFSARTRLDARRRLRDFPYRGDVLVIDAITNNPGAPGSALVNLDGEFVGLIGREVISNLTFTHFNYAIPRDVLADFVKRGLEAESKGEFMAAPQVALERHEAVDIGIRVSRAGYQSVLPFVERVIRGSPAERAGIRKDDLVLSINRKNVATADEYVAELAELAADKPIDIVLRRGRRIITVQIGAPRKNEQPTP